MFVSISHSGNRGKKKETLLSFIFSYREDGRQSSVTI